MARPNKNLTVLSPELEKKRIEESRLVRGRFHFHEVPGGELKLRFKKYPGDTLKLWEFKDNGIYTIPLGLARHLNEDCSYPEWEYVEEDGKPLNIRVGRNIQRCSFESLEFTTDCGAPKSSILRVEKV